MFRKHVLAPEGLSAMGAKVLKHLTCAECGVKVSLPGVWLDNDGVLCRDCAVLRRHMKMKHNLTQSAKNLVQWIGIDDKPPCG